MFTGSMRITPESQSMKSCHSDDIRQRNQEEQTMLKKSVLTPVLSGVLAVSVAGSGFAYYNTYVKDGKGSDKNASDGEKTVKSMLTVDEAAKVLETRIDKAQEVAKGNLDNGAKAVITYSAPQSGSIGELGLKDVTIGVEAKQKDKMSGMDYTFGYDGKNVLTMNMVYDNDSQTAYVKIPELSDAYLVGTAEDMESMSQNMSGMGGITSMQPDTSAFDDYDFDALIDDLTGYLDTIKENAPEAKDGGKYTVEKDGVKIDLDTKTYHITASDAKKVADAVAAKGKQDATLKDFCEKAGMSTEEYDEMWNIGDIDESDTETVDVDVYYIDDNPVGFDLKSSEGDVIKMVNAADDTHLIVDYDISADSDTFKMNGLVTYDNDTLDGSITASTAASGSSTGDFTIKFDNVTVSDDTSKGTMSFNGTVDGEAMNFSITFDCTGNNGTVTMTGSAGGEDFGTITIKSEETNASDITIPSGTSYKLNDENDLQKYLEGCDTESFLNSLKDALGEEMYNNLGLGSMSGMNGMNGASAGATYDDYDFGDFSDIDDLEIDA